MTLLVHGLYGPQVHGWHGYKALGLVVSEKIFFNVFPIIMTPRMGPFFDTMGMVGKIYVELQITLLHTKYRSFGSCGFRVEEFFMYLKV